MVTETVSEISGIWFDWKREDFSTLANLGRIIHLSWPKRDMDSRNNYLILRKWNGNVITRTEIQKNYTWVNAKSVTGHISENLPEQTEKLKLTLASHCSFWNLPAGLSALKQLHCDWCFVNDKDSASCKSTA